LGLKFNTKKKNVDPTKKKAKVTWDMGKILETAALTEFEQRIKSLEESQTKTEAIFT